MATTDAPAEPNVSHALEVLNTELAAAEVRLVDLNAQHADVLEQADVARRVISAAEGEIDQLKTAIHALRPRPFPGYSRPVADTPQA